MKNFEKIEVYLTPESIYMKEECGLKKHTDIYIYCFEKCAIFFILTSSTNIKIYKAKFEAGCFYKDCKQFLL